MMVIKALREEVSVSKSKLFHSGRRNRDTSFLLFFVSLCSYKAAELDRGPKKKF